MKKTQRQQVNFQQIKSINNNRQSQKVEYQTPPFSQRTNNSAPYYITPRMLFGNNSKTKSSLSSSLSTLQKYICPITQKKEHYEIFSIEDSYFLPNSSNKQWRQQVNDVMAQLNVKPFSTWDRAVKRIDSYEENLSRQSSIKHIRSFMGDSQSKDSNPIDKKQELLEEKIENLAGLGGNSHCGSDGQLRLSPLQYLDIQMQQLAANIQYLQQLVTSANSENNIYHDSCVLIDSKEIDDSFLSELKEKLVAILETAQEQSLAVTDMMKGITARTCNTQMGSVANLIRQKTSSRKSKSGSNSPSGSSDGCIGSSQRAEEQDLAKAQSLP